MHHRFRTACALLFLLVVSCRPSSPPPERPDIILISIDTLRADRLGGYGYPRPTSPAIDAFSRECVLFKNAISQSHYTAPAHMSIFTALSPFVHRIDNIEPQGETVSTLSPEIPSLVEVLASLGYATIGMHGGANLDPQFGFGRGFDSYTADFYDWEKKQGADPRHLETVLNALRKRIRDSRREGGPLFLFLHHFLCHDPYLEGPEDLRYRFVESVPEGLPDRREDPARVSDPGDEKNYFWNRVNLAEPDDRRYASDLYDGGVLYSDFLLREFLDCLRKEGVYDNAVVILLSDHGEEFYEHQGHLHENLFIENLHVPLMIKFPQGRGRGRVVETPVRTIDTLPSVFDYLGLPIAHRVQGVSFIPLLTGNGSYLPPLVSYAFARPPHHQDSVRIRDGDDVYTNFRWQGIPDWLFDAGNDPREEENLAGERIEAVERLREKTREIANSDAAFRRLFVGRAAAKKAPGVKTPAGRSSSPNTPKIDPELWNQMKALGYLK
jgi:arylsulfatase A-like enzyme